MTDTAKAQPPKPKPEGFGLLDFVGRTAAWVFFTAVAWVISAAILFILVLAVVIAVPLAILVAVFSS